MAIVERFFAKRFVRLWEVWGKDIPYLGWFKAWVVAINATMMAVVPGRYSAEDDMHMLERPSAMRKP